MSPVKVRVVIMLGGSLQNGVMSPGLLQRCDEVLRYAQVEEGQNTVVVLSGMQVNALYASEFYLAEQLRCDGKEPRVPIYAETRAQNVTESIILSQDRLRRLDIKPNELVLIAREGQILIAAISVLKYWRLGDPHKIYVAGKDATPPLTQWVEMVAAIMRMSLDPLGVWSRR